RDEIESVLADIWSEHLELGEVGVRENFFEIGGHSLAAVRIQHDIAEQLAANVPLEVFFEHPTIESLAEYVEFGGDDFDRIEASDYEDEAPLSAGQRRMWFVQKLDPDTCAFHLPGVFRLTGELDQEALERALRGVVERHEILRTVFPLRETEPVQKICETPDTLVGSIEDLRGLDNPEQRAEALIDKYIEEPFDLTADPPMRVWLLRTSEQEWVLCLVFHHIAIDEWTAGVLLEELEALYTAEVEGREPDLEELPIQYADYAIWQSEQLDGEAYEQGRQFWRDHLEGANEAIDWPIERDQSGDDHPAGYVTFAWDEQTSEALYELAEKRGTSLFVASYALFSAFLARFAGQRDVTVGLPVTQRQRPELRDLVGFFVNTIPVRTSAGASRSVEQWFEAASSSWEATGPHQWIPLEEIVEAVGAERGGGRVPLMDVMFWHLPGDRIGDRFGGLAIERFAENAVPNAKVPLEVELVGDEGPLEGHFKYDAGEFDRTDVERMAAFFERFVD
ncbi:MAG: condensation domain-containing protein, partial [Bradymonadaceae bacterium]